MTISNMTDMPVPETSWFQDEPYFLEAVYWLSFLLVPIALFLIWRLAARRHRAVTGFLLLPVLLGIYGRFVEPRLLRVAEHEVTICGQGLPGTLRAGIVSDLHHGVFRNTIPTKRIVRKLQGLDLDLVLMPGDFTQHPSPARLKASIEPLSEIGVPVYAVLGDHDVGYPGPDLTEPLTAALEAEGVILLNPGEAVFQADGKYLRIVGLRDLSQSRAEDLPLGVPKQSSPLPTIFLEHEPDTIKAAGVEGFDLMVTGHTHGGQVLLPWLTCRLTFACDTLRYGYVDNPVGKLFVTSGTGMSGLPIRLGVPPVIDVLDLTLDRCRGIQPKGNGDLFLPEAGAALSTRRSAPSTQASDERLTWPRAA